MFFVCFPKLNNNKNTRSHMELEHDARVPSLEEENTALKHKILALEELLKIHENCFQKCMQQNQKFDFKEWRSLFIQQFTEQKRCMEHVVQKQTAVKKENERNLVQCKEAINYNLLLFNTQFYSRQSECHRRLLAMTEHMATFNERVDCIKTMQTQQQACIFDLNNELGNERNLKHIYAEQIKMLCLELRTRRQHSTQLKASISQIHASVATIRNERLQINNWLRYLQYYMDNEMTTYWRQLQRILSTKSLQNAQAMLSIQHRFEAMNNCQLERYQTMQQKLLQQDKRISRLIQASEHARNVKKLESLFQLSKHILTDTTDEDVVKRLFL